MSSNWPLNNPHGIAVLNSDAYVANTGGKSIYKINLDFSAGSSDPIIFYSPSDDSNFMPCKIVYTSGNFYIIDDVNQNLYVIDTDGILKQKQSIKPNSDVSATDITFDKYGNFYIIYRSSENNYACIYTVKKSDDGTLDIDNTLTLFANISTDYTYGKIPPTCIAYNSVDDCLYYGVYNAIFYLSITQSNANTPSIKQYSYFNDYSNPTALVFDSSGKLYASTYNFYNPSIPKDLPNVIYPTLNVYLVQPGTTEVTTKLSSNSNVNKNDPPAGISLFRNIIVYTNNVTNDINTTQLLSNNTTTLSSTNKTKRMIIGNILKEIGQFISL